MHQEFSANIAARLLALAYLVCACTSTAPLPSDGQDASAESGSARFELFSREPLLYEAALRAVQRIEAAIGDSGIALTDFDTTTGCEPFDHGCGFELSSADTVYCFGNTDPARACTSFAGGGKVIGIAMQSELRGDELDNRLIHELFHVITRNRAEHSVDGLFMEYSVGTERISQSTLESVCEHFACSQFLVEEEQESSLDPVAGR